MANISSSNEWLGKNEWMWWRSIDIWRPVCEWGAVGLEYREKYFRAEKGEGCIWILGLAQSCVSGITFKREIIDLNAWGESYGLRGGRVKGWNTERVHGKKGKERELAKKGCQERLWLPGDSQERQCRGIRRHIKVSKIWQIWSTFIYTMKYT